MVGTAEKKAGMEDRIYSFSIIGNTMTKTMMVKPPYNTTVYKQKIPVQECKYNTK